MYMCVCATSSDVLPVPMKSSSSDAERRVDELLQAVEHLQELLKEAEEEKNAATELSRRVVEEQEGGRAELGKRVVSLWRYLLVCCSPCCPPPFSFSPSLPPSPSPSLYVCMCRG